MKRLYEYVHEVPYWRVPRNLSCRWTSEEGHLGLFGEEGASQLDPS